METYWAVEHALFDIYRNMIHLRLVVMILINFLSLLGIWAGFETGYYRAKLPGAILTGGLMAFLPLFVSYAGMARPYAMAWSFGVIGHYYAVTQVGHRRLLGSAIFMGLAVSSRIDMLVFAPLILWEFW